MLANKKIKARTIVESAEKSLFSDSGSESSLGREKERKSAKIIDGMSKKKKKNKKMRCGASPVLHMLTSML